MGIRGGSKRLAGEEGRSAREGGARLPSFPLTDTWGARAVGPGGSGRDSCFFRFVSDGEENGDCMPLSVLACAVLAG